jgi:hypothetical protein
MASFPLPCAPTGWSLSAVWCLTVATPRGQPGTPAVTLSQGRDGLSARRMAVFCPFRKPSLCRHVHRELLRSALLDLTPIVPATAYHHRNYVETYSKFIFVYITMATIAVLIGGVSLILGKQKK